MSDYLKPKYFDKVVRASLITASPDFDDDDELKSPSTAIKLGFDLKRMVNCKWAIAIRKSDHITKEESKNFLKLMTMEWSTSVVKLATLTLKVRSFNKEKSLPSPNDFIKLQTYLKEELHSFNCEDSSLANYKKGVKLAQTRLLMYNKRRSGELEALRIKEYVKRQIKVTDIEKSTRAKLSDMEVKLLETQELIEIRGKNNRGVPVIVPKDTSKVLKFISDAIVRQSVGIPAENKYMFANTSMGVVRAYESLKSVCKELKLEKPEKITSVNLRKYVATISQVFDLSPQQQQWLTRHMGHSLEIHNIHYKQTSGLIERIDIAKIMLMMEYGLVGKYSGKKLEDIQLDEVYNGKVNMGDIDGNEPTELDAAINLDGYDDMEENLPEIDRYIYDEVDEDEHVKSPDTSNKSKMTKKKRIYWSKDDEALIKKKFQECFNTKTCPSKEKCISANCFKGRSWEDLKKKVWNMIKT